MLHKDYVIWTASPSTGDVSMSSHGEDHPANQLAHEDLLQDRSEQDLVHGYAIRQPYGWKILSNDDKDIDDPFLITKINQALGAWPE